jgi:hypothetical protein
MTGRTLYAGLHLLDRQLIDRDGRLCGNVDDLEVTETEDGQWHVTALLSGPGALWYRLGRHRLGTWLRSRLGASFGDTDDPVRIPMHRVSDIGAAVTLSASHTEVASAAAERWVADHIISHIPGSRHDADQ